jgi:serine/threonine protein kinase/formylglycine-generating enzyme required for sulfatase activity/predicted esterase
MTPERWQEIETLYHSALKQDPSRRAAFLQEACAGDEALRKELDSLLAQQDQAKSFIEAPAMKVAAQDMASDPDQPTVVTPSRWSSHSMVGQTVSHYRILQKLGEGGMGVVYKAQDLKLERLVALKFLPHHICPDEEEKTRFIREAKAASALDHPNIGTIHEIAETDDGQMFIVMAHYEGETLKQKIERGPLPLKEAVGIAVQIAQGLAKAHGREIVHRDIKPGNILVTPDGLVKIIDFGLAKLGGLTKITQTHTTMGTVAYISPEQARGQEVDARSDVWSLGVVLYEMLTGQLPFPGAHAEAIIHSILTAKPKPLQELRPEVPAEIERIVHRALEKDLKSRYTSAADILKDLTEYQSSVALPVMGVSGWQVISGWLKQKRVVIPGLLIVLMLGSLLGWYLHRQARVHWAKEQALPEINRLIDEEKYMAAYALAQQAEKHIPTEASLVKFWPAMSSDISIRTSPSGADIFMKEYAPASAGWSYLGQSPLDRIRIPWGGLQFKAEKKGFAPVQTVESGRYILPDALISLNLDLEGSLPPGMVHASGGKLPIKLNFPGFEDLESVPLLDYWIDKYEVTNREFKVFVEGGGYQKRQYWKQPFVKAGRKISWDEAMAEFRDTTGRPGPSTWELGHYPEGQEDYPVTGVSWYEAAAYAEFAGKSLPTIYHWENAAGPFIAPYLVPRSNFRNQGPVAVGSYQGMSRYGTYDMAGNVKEWCWNEADVNKRYILGGAWNEPDYMFNALAAQSPIDRHASFGFRCVKYSPGDGLSSKSSGLVKFAARNYAEERPVSDEIFQIYKSLYSYDKTPLNSTIESTDEHDENWVEQKISYDAAYGKERVIAHLFLPKKALPPYQTVVYFPGAIAFYLPSINTFYMRLMDFIIVGGRAVLWPIYKDTYERGGELKSDYPNMTSLYRDHVIYWTKDLRRSIDYLETRSDIDHNRIGFYGYSWGAGVAPIMTSLEDRFKVSVLPAGGFYLQKGLPEVDAINFAPRVRIPTLMLNGEHDFTFPAETSQKPMFRLLATPEEHKRYIVYEGGHLIPRNQLIKETLDWLDRYLGPVNRREQ